MTSPSQILDDVFELLSENQGVVIGVCVTVLVIAGTQLAVSAGLSTYLSNKRGGVLTDAYKPYPLISRTEVSPNTRLFRFGLPSEESRLGLPLGGHISLRAIVNGEETRRPYTPTTSDSETGHFDLVIKVYPEPHGKMSRHLDSLEIGDTIDVRGPLCRFKYTPQKYTQLGMIAGGTGITPMWQVFCEILQDPNDHTTISLIFANVNVDDILLKEEIDALVSKHDNFSVYYVLNNPPEDWNGGVGFVSEDMIRDHFGEPTQDKQVLLCGPPPMNKAMKAHLATVGYPESQVFKF